MLCEIINQPHAPRRHEEFELTRFAPSFRLKPSRQSGERRLGIRRTVAILTVPVLIGSMTTLMVATPVMVGAASPEAASVAYQVDAAHDGDQPNEILPTSPVVKWSHNFGNSVSYPLIVDNQVFVTVSGDGEGGYGSELYALDASSGDGLWGPIELGGTDDRAGIAYDNGFVFAINYSGQLTAFEAATGDEEWTTALPGQYAFSSPPTASGGVVYVGGAGIGGTLYAVDETNGELLWTGSVANGDQSSPAVSDTGVYVSYACEQTYDFAPTTGDLIWQHATDCEGGGGRTPALSNGNLYVRDSAGMSPVVLSASTGAQLGSFSSATAPAFDNGLEFTMEQGTLAAIQASTGTEVWSQTGDGSLDSAPIVVGGSVYVGGSSGLVASFNENTGVETWSANAGSPILAPDEQNLSDELTGLGAGDGLLVVPASDTLVAFGAPTTPSAPTIGTGTPGNESATVSFTAPVSDGGSPITSFTVTASDLTNPANGRQVVSGSNSPLTVSGLIGDSYTFTVTATNAAGTGPASSPSNAVTPVTPPAAPTIGTATPGNESATVSFTAPVSDGGSPITGFAVDASDLTNAARGGQMAGGSVSPLTVSGLTDGDSYTFTVVAINAPGNGPASGPSNAVTPVAASPPPAAAPSAAPSPSLTPQDEHGYWLVGSDGGIFTFGNAQFYGSTGNIHLQRPVVSITPTANDGGYWLVASDGGIFSFGDAGFFGSIPGLGIAPAGSGSPHSLNAPIVGMVPTADGGGYFMVASDGGVFTFGDAKFEGSCPSIGGCAGGAAVAVMPDATGNGYWVVTAGGDVQPFGDAPSPGEPAVPGVVAAVRSSDGEGYYLLYSNGVVYSAGDAVNYGNATGVVGGYNPATAIFTTADGKGYWIVAANGSVITAGDAPYEGGANSLHLNGSIIAGTGW